MRLILAFATAALITSCAAAQKPPTERRAGSCLVQESESVTRVSNAEFGFSIELPFDGWKVECGESPRVLFAYSKSLGLHVTGELLKTPGKFDAHKLLRAVYALAREKAMRSGTRCGEAEFDVGADGAILRYEVLLDHAQVSDEDRTSIRSVHEFKPLETGKDRLLLLHVSWTGSNQSYEGLRKDISMPVKTFLSAQ
jgi:hypothetical protein